MSYIVLIIYLQYHSNVHEGHKWDLDISLLSGNFVGEIHLFINSNDVSPQVQVDVFHFESLAYDEVSYSHACRQALFLIRIIIQKHMHGFGYKNNSQEQAEANLFTLPIHQKISELDLQIYCLQSMSGNLNFSKYVFQESSKQLLS